MLIPLLFVLAASQSQAPTLSGVRLEARQRQPNIVLILADDFGVDLVSGYGESPAPPCTPNIDSLAAGGLLFRNAWTNPVCTPTRAAVLTGRHGFRTGLGTPGANGLLPLTERTIPEMLRGYSTACLGKWHLAPGNNPTHPNDSGFDHFAGTVRGGVPNYFGWTKVIDGVSSTTTNYVTVDTADDAIAILPSLPEPFFLYVSFHAPHSPWHEPPISACGPATCAQTYCGNLPANPSTPQLVRAMTESLDHQVGRVLASLDTIDPDAFVVFMGDNGTTRQATTSPFVPGHSKGTVYEGGVNVPLIVRGPKVTVGECDALVSSVDLFATFAELAHIPATTEDSLSLVPYFGDPSLQLRETVYAEQFSPNGGSLPFASHDRAVRDDRYKLLRQTGMPDEFYDLAVDPFEATNLLPGLAAREQVAHDALVARLVALGVD